MKVTATEFKAKCLALIDKVHKSGERIVITKRGKVVASLVGDGDARPWEKMRGKAHWVGDPLRPAVEESEVEALK